MKNNAGFTLIEIILSLLLLMISFFASAKQLSTSLQVWHKASQNIQNVLIIMNKNELNHASLTAYQLFRSGA